MNYILETQDLTKKYDNHVVVDHVNIFVRTGAVYGLIGQNGAGKTAILKIIGGLAKQTSGKIYLSKTDKQNNEQDTSKVGVLIEQPGIYPEMSAKQNLKLKCLAMGVNSKAHIDELLKVVGLSKAGKKPVKKYSLGMRQRLGIALALVGYPDLVILDEPINGRDPQGIVEFREMIAQLNSERNITFIISSHILGELSKSATDYGIIHNGKMIEQMSKEQFLEKCNKTGIGEQADLEAYYLNLTGV